MSYINRAIDWANQSQYAWLLRSEVFRYLISGGTAFVVLMVVLIFLVEVFSVGEVLATAIGLICATPVNYNLQKRFVFRSQAPVGKSFVIYCVVTIATMLLNVEFFYLILKYTDIHYTIAQVITTGIIVVLNYFVNRHLTFSHALK
jgi:putative flippase GtrA